MSFTRHAVMLLGEAGAGEALVVLDEVKNSLPEPVDLFWHCAGEVVPASGLAGVIEGATAKLNYRLATSGKGQLHVLSRQTAASNVPGPAASGGNGKALHFSIAGATNLLIASVFARKSVGAITIKRPHAGEIHLQAGSIELLLKSRKGGTELARCSV